MGEFAILLQRLLIEIHLKITAFKIRLERENTSRNATRGVTAKEKYYDVLFHEKNNCSNCDSLTICNKFYWPKYK